MISPKNLSINELKKFHKATREKIDCAKQNDENDLMNLIKPGFNRVKAEGKVVLRMIDEEFDHRGYNVEKLFKGYKIT